MGLVLAPRALALAAQVAAQVLRVVRRARAPGPARGEVAAPAVVADTRAGRNRVGPEEVRTPAVHSRAVHSRAVPAVAPPGTPDTRREPADRIAALAGAWRSSCCNPPRERRQSSSGGGACPAWRPSLADCARDPRHRLGPADFSDPSFFTSMTSTLNDAPAGSWRRMHRTGTNGARGSPARRGARLQSGGARDEPSRVNRARDEEPQVKTPSPSATRKLQ